MIDIKKLCGVAIAIQLSVSAVAAAVDKPDANTIYFFAKVGSAKTDVDNQQIIEPITYFYAQFAHGCAYKDNAGAFIGTNGMPRCHACTGMCMLECCREQASGWQIAAIETVKGRGNCRGFFV